MKILAISLGTRDSGVALLSHGQLVHWKMHTFHGTWSTEKLNDILVRFDRYITRHRVQHVVIKIPPSTHHTKAFLTLLKKLTELLHYRGCIVACQTKADIKAYVPEVTNTESLMSYVTRHYPILLPEQNLELINRQRYYVKMFEAVLAAHIHSQQINWEDFREI